MYYISEKYFLGEFIECLSTHYNFALKPVVPSTYFPARLSSSVYKHISSDDPINLITVAKQWKLNVNGK